MSKPRAQALGHGSAAVAGDNYAPITTNTFVGKWYRLADAVQRWDAYVDGKLGDDFHDRESLAAKVSALVSGEAADRGFLLLESGLGMGKTTFAAWLSRQGGYPTHFTQLNPDARHQATAIRSLTAQLIAAWDLHDLAPDGLLPSVSDTSDWFARVLAAAAERRDQLATERGGDTADSPIVLVVDALDAALSHPDGHLPLGLPSDLPRGVYIVATSRTGAVRHLSAGARVCGFSGQDDGNLADLRGHLESQAHQPWLTDILSGAEIPVERFVDTLAERSRGVWIYIHYVLENLRSDPDLVRRLPQLPKGLDAYYHDNLLPLCDGDQARVVLPLLGTLAVAAEPLNSRALATLAGLTLADDVTLVDRVLNGVLRPFCSVRSVTFEDGPTRVFEALHSSLGEYLSAGPDPESTGTDSHERLRELTARSCREAHHRICDRYLSLWGGLSTGVSVLATSPAALRSDRGYALRWLITHLEAAGRADDIHRLLAAEHSSKNVWYQCHDISGDLTAYLNDVEQAKRLAPDRGDWLRYRLIEAGIATMSVAVPPNISEQLVKRGLWTIDRAFSVLERASRRAVHARTLARLIPRLPDDLLGRALSLAAQLHDGEDRAGVLCALIPRLPEGMLPTVVPVLESVRGQGTIAKPLAALIARWPLDRTGDRWEPTTGNCSHDEMNRYVDMFVRLRGSGDCHSGGLLALRQAEAEASIDPVAYPRLIGALIPYLPSELFGDVLAAVRESNLRYADGALAELMELAPDDQLDSVLALVNEMDASGGELSDAVEARLTAILLSRSDGAVPDTHLEFIATKLHPRHLVSVVPLLDERQVRDLISRLDTLTRDCDEYSTFMNRDVPARLVNALAQRLPAPEGAQLVMARFGQYPPANTFDPRLLDTEVVAPLVGWYPEEVRNDLLAQTFRSIENYVSGGLFSSVDILAPYLTDDELRTALGHCTEFVLEEQCFAAIAALASQLPSENIETAMLDALSIAEGIEYEEHQAEAVANLGAAIPEALITEALDIIESFNDPWLKLETFGSVMSPATPLQPMRPLDVMNVFADQGSVLDLRTRASPGVYTYLGSEHPSIFDKLIHNLLTSDPDPPRQRDPALTAKFPLWRDDLRALAPFLAPEQAWLAWDLIEQTKHWKRYGRDDCRTVEVRAHLAARFDEDDRAAAVDNLLTGWLGEDWLATLPHADTEATAKTLAALGHAAMTCQLEAAYRRFWELLPHSSEAHKVLSILEATIPRTLSTAALEYALHEERNDLNVKALQHLGPCLNDIDRERVIRHLSDPSHHDSHNSATAIVAMLPYVTADDRQELITFVSREISPEFDAAALTKLVRYVVGDLRRACVDLAGDHCLRNGDWWEYGTEAELLRQFSAGELRELYARASDMSAYESPTAFRAAILTELGNRPRHDRSPPDWDPTAALPTRIARGELFTLIAASAWWIDDQYGRSGCAKMLTAVFDVARWWP